MKLLWFSRSEVERYKRARPRVSSPRKANARTGDGDRAPCFGQLYALLTNAQRLALLARGFLASGRRRGGWRCLLDR